jgi:mRNA interferase MazF
MATQKDFAGWLEYKIYAQHKQDIPFFYEKEIWWASIGHNIGSEEDGKGRKYARPVLIMRKFNQYLFWGIPLSSKRRQGRYYVSVFYRNKLDAALLSQLKAFDSKRLIRLIGRIDDFNFVQVQLGLVAILRNKPQK